MDVKDGQTRQGRSNHCTVPGEDTKSLTTRAANGRRMEKAEDAIPLAYVVRKCTDSALSCITSCLGVY